MKRWAMALFVFAGGLLTGSAALAQPATGSFGFNGSVSGFPTGAVRITGGGAYDLASSFVHSGGGFRCLEDVLQGPLSMSINADDPGPCLGGEGVRWDTAGLLTSTQFKCTGAVTEAAKTATTSDTTVVLQADFYRAGDANDESFTAQMIVSETEIAPKNLPGRMWVHLGPPESYSTPKPTNITGAEWTGASVPPARRPAFSAESADPRDQHL